MLEEENVEPAPGEAPRIEFSSQWPTTDPALFGRGEELAILDRAWEEGANVVSFVAFGGVGKTALVNAWLFGIKDSDRRGIMDENWRGAERVYGWSFYSQGAEEGRQASADHFLDRALRWFGDTKTADSRQSAWDKGTRLAELVRERRTLLLLDGIEPLQEPPGSSAGREGKIKDLGLAGLLRHLALGNPGLCVVTTRLPIEDLKMFEGWAGCQTAPQRPDDHVSHSGAVWHEDLDNLTEETGAAYLKQLGVVGSEKQLREAVREYDGHALALTLLGRFLKTHRDGDIRRRDDIPPGRLFEERKQGRHALRVMALYQRWFEGKPELDILHILGLFDRPAEAGAIEAVRADPPIEGLTSNLHDLSREDWNNALETLREARLLAVPPPGGVGSASQTDEAGTTGKSPAKAGTTNSETATTSLALDCHPLVREFFGERLKEENPAAWKEGHNRLYEYFKALPERLCGKFLPDTIEEMMPLYQAVLHGCQARLYREALHEAMIPRIQRGKEYYSSYHLGAFGADLAAFFCFLPALGDFQAFGMERKDQAYISKEVGYCLRSLGRFEEAIRKLKEAVRLYASLESWIDKADCFQFLSSIHCACGRLREAQENAEESVKEADVTGCSHTRITKRAVLARVLHYMGKLKEAEDLFREAEAIQVESTESFDRLCSFPGALFCELILTQGDYERVSDRSSECLSLGCGEKLVNMGHFRLWRGVAHVCADRLKRKSVSGEAEKDYDIAIEQYRHAAYQETLAQGLVARGEMYQIANAYGPAKRDLEEAWEIATRNGMLLYVCDVHLECCRVLLAMVEAEKGLDWTALAPDSPFRHGMPEALECGGLTPLSDRGEKPAKRRADESGRSGAAPAEGEDSNGASRASRGESAVEPAQSKEASPQQMVAAARAHLKQAKKMVDEMGYHRRDPEILLETGHLHIVLAELGDAPGPNHASAREKLVAAKKTIDEMGCHRWDVDVNAFKERVEKGDG